MDFLNAYDDDDDTDETIGQTATQLNKVCSAPSTVTSLHHSKQNNSTAVTGSNSLVPFNSTINYTADVYLQPSYNVPNPYNSRESSNDNNRSSYANRIGTGNIETIAVEDSTFEEQYRHYQRNGYAYHTQTNELLGCKPVHEEQQSKRRKAVSTGTSMGDITGDDIWASVEYIKPVIRTDIEDKAAAKKSVALPYKLDDTHASTSATNASSASVALNHTSIDSSKWLRPPLDLKPSDGDHECYIPKKCIKEYKGHTKGVQEIELFPKYGHLLLSGSLDGTCKMWNVFNDRNLLHTYTGHHEAVRSINFNQKGSSFVSSSFDKSVKLWDVATGVEVSTFSNNRMGYQVRYNPNDDNIFLIAASDNRIYQWDIRTKQVCQEYNYHLGPCNAVLFFDNGRKFISTSDDKKILVWEHDIPVPIKYIQEQEMQSIPSMSLHPSGTCFVGQSMDNTIVTYSCSEKVKQMKNKTFKGQYNCGYACQIGFSPNGKFMMSGDGDGKLNVWDWKTMKLYRKFQAHAEKSPCIGTIWHPIMPSWVFTCGWDGLIKLWD